MSSEYLNSTVVLNEPQNKVQRTIPDELSSAETVSIPQCQGARLSDMEGHILWFGWHSVRGIIIADGLNDAVQLL